MLQTLSCTLVFLACIPFYGKRWTIHTKVELELNAGNTGSFRIFGGDRWNRIDERHNKTDCMLEGESLHLEMSGFPLDSDFSDYVSDQRVVLSDLKYDGRRLTGTIELVSECGGWHTKRASLSLTAGDQGYSSFLSEVAIAPPASASIKQEYFFLSLRFTSELKDYASELKAELEAYGHRVYLCQGPSGNDFGDEIDVALDQSTKMIALLTEDPPYGHEASCVYSTFYELKFYSEQRKPIVPVLMKEGGEYPPTKKLYEGGHDKAAAKVKKVLGPSLSYVTNKDNDPKYVAKKIVDV